MSRNIPKEIAELELKDITFLATLGVGGFGRVELVSILRPIGLIQDFNVLNVLEVEKHMLLPRGKRVNQ